MASSLQFLSLFASRFFCACDPTILHGIRTQEDLVRRSTYFSLQVIKDWSTHKGWIIPCQWFSHHSITLNGSQKFSFSSKAKDFIRLQCELNQRLILHLRNQSILTRWMKHLGFYAYRYLWIFSTMWKMIPHQIKYGPHLRVYLGNTTITIAR